MSSISPAKIVSYRHLGRRNQSEAAFVIRKEQVLCKLRELPRAKQRIAIHEKRRQRLGVAASRCVSSMKLTRPVRSRATGAVEDRESRAGDFARARSRSSMPSAVPRSTWSFGSKSNSAGSPQRRISCLLDSSGPTGTSAAGIFGRPCEQLLHRGIGLVSLSFELGLLVFSRRPPLFRLGLVLLPACISARSPCWRCCAADLSHRLRR